MATALFAPTTAAATSADIVVAADAVVVVSINGDSGFLYVERETSTAGVWVEVAQLVDGKNAAQGIALPGKYRVRKLATAQPVGADRD